MPVLENGRDYYRVVDRAYRMAKYGLKRLHGRSPGDDQLLNDPSE